MMTDLNGGLPKEMRYYQVAAADTLPNGERLFIEVTGHPIVIFNIGGNLFAIDDICTHDGGPLGDGILEGHAIVCPRHGARFDIRSGKGLALPAYTDVETYPVRISNGMIEIGIPDESK